MQYQPNDLVWARCCTESGGKGERAGIVRALIGHLIPESRRTPICGEIYAVTLQDSPHLEDQFCVCCLRPRRDDYQQHEPVGIREDLGIEFHTACEKETV
jgi:hypothetical protein